MLKRIPEWVEVVKGLQGKAQLTEEDVTTIRNLRDVNFGDLQDWKNSIASLNRSVDAQRDSRTGLHAGELQKIMFSPVLKAYYRGVRLEFNSLFVGCLAVHSGLVSRSTKMSEDVVEAVCELGSGVPILAFVLKVASQAYRMKTGQDSRAWVQRVLDMLGGSGDMLEASYLAERIARELTTTQLSTLSGDLDASRKASAWRRKYEEVKAAVKGFRTGRSETALDRKVVHDVELMFKAVLVGEGKVDTSNPDAMVASLVKLVTGVDVQPPAPPGRASLSREEFLRLEGEVKALRRDRFSATKKEELKRVTGIINALVRVDGDEQASVTIQDGKKLVIEPSAAHEQQLRELQQIVLRMQEDHEELHGSLGQKNHRYCRCAIM